MMADVKAKADEVLAGDELQRRWQAIASSMEAMSVEASKLLSALKPGDLPDDVLRRIEATTRPFTTAIGEFMKECRGFQDYAKRFDASIASRARAASYDEFFEKPLVGKAVN
jgi:hypothetical protein